MKKRILIVLLAVLLLLAGCSSNNAVQGSRTPEKLIERYAAALYADNEADAWDRFACMGFVLTEEKDPDSYGINLLLEPGEEWAITSLDIHIFSDAEFDEMMTYFQEDWLDYGALNYYGCRLVYTVSDVKQIGKAVFTLESATGGQQRWTYVVKTNQGWFCTG